MNINISGLLLLAILVTAHGAQDTLNAAATAAGNNQWANATNCASLDDNDASEGTQNDRLEVVINNSSDSGEINWVKVRVAVWIDEWPGGGGLFGSDGGVRIGHRLNGGTWYQGSDQNASDQESYLDETWTTDPSDGGAWTWTDVDNLEAGCRAHQYSKGFWGTLNWYCDHVMVIVDYNAFPDITGLSAGANATGTQIDSGTVQINYEVFHVDDDAVTITARYRAGGTGPWTNLTTVFLDTGYVDANSSSTDRTISWDVATDLGLNIDANYEVRIIAADTNQTTQKDSVVTSSFLIDTRDPVNLANLTITSVGQDSVNLQWTQASDNQFNHYEIWYGSDSANVAQRSVNMSEWDDNDDADLNNATTTSTTVSGLSILTRYYFQIWAVDDAGNEMTTAPVCTTTLTSAVPQVTGWDPRADVNTVQYNTDSVRIEFEVFDADDSTASITMEMRLLNAAGWTPWTTMDAYVSGDSGWINTDQTANDTLIWNARAQLGSVDTTAYVRVIAVDSSDNRDTSTSVGFTLDTEVPSFTGTLNTGTATSSTVPLSWTGTATDGNFSHYEIWYGTVIGQVEGKLNGAAEWDDDPNDPALASSSTNSTTITGLLSNTTYYFRIWAVDDFGNETNLATVSTTTALSTTVDIVKIEDNILMTGGSTGNYNFGASIERGSATIGGFFNWDNWTNCDVRSLVKIYLDTLPTGATIDTAYFIATCHTETGGAYTVNCRQVLVDWTEGNSNESTESGASCWNYRNHSSTPWTTAGCGSDGNDRSSSVIASTSVNTATTYSWGSSVLKQLVQDWHNGTTGNYGLLFESAAAETDGNLKEFYSSEHSGSQPKLVVGYHLDVPIVSGLYDSTYITAYHGEIDTVTIKYELSDGNHDSAYITAQYKPSGGSWASITNVFGDVDDSVYASDAAADRTIRWGVREQLGGFVDGNYYVRLISTDPWNLKDTTESYSFGIDTKAPGGLSGFSVTDSFSFWLECSWNAVSDEGHFNHYEIWYGSNKNDVQNRTGTAMEWDGDDNNGMNEVATNIMKIKNLSSSTKYYLRIYAIDDMGNEATTTLDSATTLDDPIPTVTGWAQAANVNAEQINKDSVRIGYMMIDIDSDTAHAKFEFMRYNGGWDTPTAANTFGDTGYMPTGESIQDTIIWDARSDPKIAATEDTLYYVKVISLDDSGFTDTTLSAAFFIDLVAPQGMSSLNVSSIDANSADLTWTAANNEVNFSHYEIWYGTNLADVQGRTGTANEWDDDNDALLGTMNTTGTTITGLLPGQTYYFKIWAVDDFGNDATDTYASDNTSASNNPVVTGPGGAALVDAGQTDSTTVTINYELSNAGPDAATVSAEYQVYGGSGWTAFTTTGGSDYGAGITQGTGKSFTWSASTDLNNDGKPLDSVYTIRVTATDEQPQSHTAYSDTFTIDIQAPTGLNNFHASDTLGLSITFTWDAATDRNFDHYEICRATTQGNAQTKNGTIWDNDDDAGLSSNATTTTTVTGLTINTTYWWSIWAVDKKGNQSTITPAIRVDTKNMVTPQWSKSSMGVVQGGAIAEGRMYAGSGASVYKLSCINLSNGNEIWSYPTKAYGACNTPSYDYVDGSYKVVASAGNYVFCLRDNGGNYTELFTPVNLGSTAGNPYISPDGTDSAFYVVYAGNLSKRNLYDGTEVWTVGVSNATPDADIVVFDDVVFVGSTTGMVYKRNASDGSPNQSYNASNKISLPLLVQGGSLYITPDNSTLYSVNSSNLTQTNWTLPLGTNNSGPAFISKGGNDIFVAASDSVKKVNVSSGTRIWSYYSSDTVASGPIPNGNYVYFGTNNGKYVAIDNTPSLVSKWPYTNISGDANSGPWIDEGNSRVIFGTTGGNLNAFALETRFGEDQTAQNKLILIKNNSSNVFEKSKGKNKPIIKNLPFSD